MKIRLVLALAVIVTSLSASSLQAEYFNGERLVDRTQVAIVFSRILFHTHQLPESLSWRDVSYKDVPAVYARPVGTVTSLGIIPAFEDKFNGRGFVTRYELGRWVRRLLRRIRVAGPPLNSNLTPIDIPISHRDRDPAIEAVWRKIMAPRSREYKGKHYVSRFELAHICANLARHFCLRPHLNVKLHLEDIPKDHWARADVEYACSTGILNTRGVGHIAIYEEQKAYKSEHIGRVRRRRGTVHGSFKEEFQPEDNLETLPTSQP